MERRDGRRDVEIASLLALGWEPARVSTATGIPEAEFPAIVKALKEAHALHRTAAKRGRDVKGVLTAAAAYQRSLSADPFAPPPADLAGIIGRKVDIDPGLAGLDRRIMVAFTEYGDATARDSLFQVGVEDAWESAGILCGRYVLPSGADASDAWNLHVSWNHVASYLDVRVEAMAQSINPSSLIMLRGVMDWELWRLRAEHVVRHDEVIGRFDSYKHRSIVLSTKRDVADHVGQALDHEQAAMLVRGAGKAEMDTALAYHQRRAWVPFVALDPAWREEWLNRVVLVLHGLPAGSDRKLEALATLLPVATLYTGEGRTCLGAGKDTVQPVAIIDGLVPKGAQCMLATSVLAVASILTRDVVLMSECTTHPIPYPRGYPSDDITRVYKPGGTRASVAGAGGKLLPFADHWRAQQEGSR